MESARTMALSPDPVLSVVICHHTGRRFLEACLASVAGSQGVTFETLVITSDPEYYVPDPLAHWVEAHYVEGGPAHKRNVGVDKSRGQYLVFLDDDATVSPYTLYEFWRGFQVLPQAKMLFARIYNSERRQELDDCGSWLTWTGFLYARAGDADRLDSATLLRPTRCLASKSAGCAIRRTTFYDVGGFDATYFILGEETDLAWRVWLRGGEVWYWPTAVLWHAFNTSAKPVADYYTLERIHYRGVRNYLSLLWTSLGTLRLVSILPLHLSLWLVAAVGFSLRGQRNRGWLILRGIWDFWTHLPTAKRQRVQSTRVCTDRQLWPLIAYAPHWTYYPQRMIRYVWNGLHG